MIELFTQNPLLFYLVVFLISVLSTTLSIGGFILIPLAALFFGAKESIGIITLYFLSQNISKLFFFRDHIHREIAKKIIIWAIPGVLLGATLLVHIPEVFFSKVLGVGMIIFIVNDWMRYKSKNRSSEKNLPLFSLLYGFFSGIVGSGNLIKGPLFLSLGLLKESYIATYALTSFFINIPKIGIYFYSGIITQATFIRSVPFLLLSIMGTWIGKHMLSHISNRVFYYLTMASFLIASVALLIE